MLYFIKCCLFVSLLKNSSFFHWIFMSPIKCAFTLEGWVPCLLICAASFVVSFLLHPSNTIIFMCDITDIVQAHTVICGHCRWWSWCSAPASSKNRTPPFGSCWSLSTDFQRTSARTALLACKWRWKIHTMLEVNCKAYIIGYIDAFFRSQQYHNDGNLLYA